MKRNYRVNKLSVLLPNNVPCTSPLEQRREKKKNILQSHREKNTSEFDNLARVAHFARVGLHTALPAHMP